MNAPEAISSPAASSPAPTRAPEATRVVPLALGAWALSALGLALCEPFTASRAPLVPLTIAALTAAQVVAYRRSGALRSPMLPLLFAPTGVAFAAFGVDRPARAQALLFALALALLFVASHLAPLARFAPAPSSDTVVALYAMSALSTAALLWLGVAGLVGAYRSAGAARTRGTRARATPCARPRR